MEIHRIFNPNLNQQTQEEGSALGNSMSLISAAVSPTDVREDSTTYYFHLVDLGLEDKTRKIGVASKFDITLVKK